ncbi:MAG: ATP synthase subunit C [Firmicutes bacterium]|nr:ATP synthase subunit C [Bacillota bacterium]
MNYVALLLGILLLFVPFALIALRKLRGKKAKNMLFGNIAAFFGIFLLASVFTLSGHAMAAAADTTATGTAAGDLSAGLKYISAALAVGISGIASGIAVASVASSAMGALSENDSIFGKAIVFVAMAEGIALFGLIVAILLINA